MLSLHILYIWIYIYLDIHTSKRWKWKKRSYERYWQLKLFLITDKYELECILASLKYRLKQGKKISFKPLIGINGNCPGLPNGGKNASKKKENEKEVFAMLIYKKNCSKTIKIGGVKNLRGRRRNGCLWKGLAPPPTIETRLFKKKPTLLCSLKRTQDILFTFLWLWVYQITI